MVREQLSATEPLLRDRLALDRTILANERTFLAYVRTALAFLITGIGLLKFSQELMLEILGITFIIGSTVAIAIGIRRYRYFNRLYQQILQEDAGQLNR